MAQEEVSSLSALMEFLRLLCENHYLEMQDYMRKQPDNLRSYNVVRKKKKGKGGVFQFREQNHICIV